MNRTFNAVLFMLAISIVYAQQAGLSHQSMEELILNQGYPLEVHEIETEDGYLLTAYRIPYGKDKASNGKSVIVQHGILCSSAAWVISRPDQALGFLLADGGYDVWLTNSRGNTYSRKHKTYDTSSAQYWDFSFHEMGYYDLPATIDYILEKTNETQLFYIGHSQGTTQFFAMASTRPEYNAKIRHMSALAPIAFLDHTRGTVRTLGFFASVLQKVAWLLNLHYILDQSFVMSFIERTACRQTAITRPICDNILFLIAGYDSQELNVTLVPVITSYTPAGASVKQLLHFSQLLHNNEKFTLYDYGEKYNVFHYGQNTPPQYDLSKVTAPVMLHYAYNDWISGVQDVDKLYTHLPNSKRKVVGFDFFNHLDFMWARDARQLVYDDVLDIMSQY
uniref:Lipase n=1 Tax=Riptortus pedestris TaxID=329032 RepID=R4WRP2_RIPPE|nr:lipase 1 precursor [Riptortus pedestris]